MTYSAIIGLGHYVPAFTVSNDDLSLFLDTNHEWIHSRTGIVNRHIAKAETNYEMASKAAERALAQAGFKGEDLDLIVLATFSGEYATPSMACLVQKALGAKRAMCFDLSAACSGFVYALDVADQFIKNGKFQNALVIGSEKLSQILDWEDRGTCVLFGDGAGAALLASTSKEGIRATLNRSIGEDYESLYAMNPINKTPYYEGSDEHVLKMNGQEVFQFACTRVPEVLLDLADQLKMPLDEVDLFVLHQANERIINKIAKRLKLPIDRFYMNMNEYGNTSAASIPIALSELQEDKQLKGKKVMVAGFGAGLTYGASLIQF